MNSLSERLDTYAALPPEERAVIEHEVAASGSTAAAAALAAAQSLARVLDAAARPGASVTDDDLAAYLADQSLGLTPHDPDRIEAALADDDSLRARADAMRARLGLLDSHTPDEPLGDRFERLFGHGLPAEGAPDTAPAEAPHTRRTPERPAAAARPAAAPPRARRRMVTRALAVVGALAVVAYGGLYQFGPQLQNSPEERVRIAVADLADLPSYAPMVTRGAETDALAERLDAALDAVADARRTTLGLFPRYDEDRLSAAATDLAALVGASTPSTSVSQEARFALARVRLHQHRDTEAVRLLGALVREQSYRAPEARRLIDFVRTRE